MKTKLFYIMLAALIFSGYVSAAYDIVTVDIGNSEITRLDVEGNIVWQKALGNSMVDAAVDENGNVYVADNTNKRLMFVAGWSGENRTIFTDGQRCLGVAIGADYNSDGTNDVYIIGGDSESGRLAVVGGGGNGNEGKLLATNSAVYVYGDASVAYANGEIYLIGNTRVAVFNASDISTVTRTFDVNINIVKGGVIKNGKLYYGDANTSTRNFIAWYNTDGTSTEMTKVLLSGAVNYPQFFEFAPDGKCYIPNRYATGDRTDASVDVFDSNWNYVKTLYQKAGANFTAAAIVPVQDGFKEFLVVDGSVNYTLRKFNYVGDLLWESTGFRSTLNMTQGPDGMIYCFRGSTDKVIDVINPADGGYVKRFYTSSPLRSYDGEFAYDYNQDGILDLYALIGDVTTTYTSFASLMVFSGPGAANEGTILAQIDNLMASSITAGMDVATVATATDPNSPDGVDELYLIHGANGSSYPHAMYIVEPTTLRMVKAYDLQRKDNGGVVPSATVNPSYSVSGNNDIRFGPDGYLYVNSHYNDRYARFKVSLTDSVVSIVQSGIGGANFFASNAIANNPSGFDFDDTKMYSANRFALGADTSPGVVSIINGNATSGGVFATAAGVGRCDGVLIIDATQCPFNYAADLNGDCFRDGGDIAIIAADWLACTDPVVSNCD